MQMKFCVMIQQLIPPGKLAMYVVIFDQIDL